MRALFIANDSLVLPILFSQGLPHLRSLAGRGHHLWVLSFEGAQTYYSGQRQRYKEVQRRLAKSGIVALAPPAWVFRVLPATLAKLLFGSIYAVALTASKRIRVIHARSFFPALIALVCKRLLRTRLIFDMRSLYVDEQVPLGRARPGTLKYRLLRWLERDLLRSSDAVVAVSEPFAAHVRSRVDVWKEPPAARIFVIPNCVDTGRFWPCAEARSRSRRRLGADSRTVLLATMSWLSQRYAVEEMARFFQEYKKLDASAFFLVLANRPQPADAERLLGGMGIVPSDLRVVNADPGEVAGLMQAGDVGIFFGGRGFQQKIMFPIKFAEYLAVGMPVVVNRGVGQIQEIVERERVGIVVDIASGAGLAAGARELRRLLAEDRDEIRARCRRLAERELPLARAVDAYDRIYRELGNSR